MSSATTSLILFGSDSPTVLPSAMEVINQWTAFVRAKRPEDPLPVNSLGQAVADDIRESLSKANAFLGEFEKAAKAAREPYYERFKAMKSASDRAIMEFATALGELTSDLRDFELEKRRVEERINRQREEEAAAKRREEEQRQRAAEEERRRAEQAERERIAAIERQRQQEQDAARRAELDHQAEEERKRAEAAAEQRDAQRLAEQQQIQAIQPERLEMAKTEGATVKTHFTYEVTDLYLFLAWCVNNRRGWINEAKLVDCFLKREITAALNVPSPDHDIPGIRVYRELAVNVKRARTPKAITIASSRVEM